MPRDNNSNLLIVDKNFLLGLRLIVVGLLFSELFGDNDDGDDDWCSKTITGV
jgi:hypothetical protein